jgi:hypothetical protein
MKQVGMAETPSPFSLARADLDIQNENDDIRRWRWM